MPPINDKILLNFREVSRALQELPRGVVKNVVRRSVYAGATKIRDVAKSKVPVDTGALRASVVAIRNKIDRSGEITSSVGVARKKFVRGRRGGKSPRRYAHLVEFGTAKVAASPFLRPAMDTQLDAVLDVTAKKMREGIDVEAAKIARRARR